MTYGELVNNLRQKHRAYVATSNAKAGQIFLDAAYAIEELDDICQHQADEIRELRKAVLRLEDESGLYDELPTFYIYPTKWIPVRERLPLLNTPVLATDGIEVDISWMYGVPPRWITSYTAIDEDKLTHWMPLPQTPKDGD